MQALEKLDGTKLVNNDHWTANNPVRQVRYVASDLMAQVESVMEQYGYNNGDLAEKLDVTLGRVSQVMNSPGNITLKNAVLYTGALDMNVAMVVYPSNHPRAPISGDVFRACWEVAGRPTNMFEVQDNSVGIINNSGAGLALIGHAWTAPPVNPGCGPCFEITAKTGYAETIINTHIEDKSASSKGTQITHG